MLHNLKMFIKKEYVFCISFVLAVATMFFVPPDSEYIHYIDFRVLCLLFCLMAVVEGFKSVGVFGFLTDHLLKKVNSARALGITLVMLPFFVSMLVTNDVALIVFIPFTIALLSDTGLKKSIVPVIVFQTVAANLGSMATPVGNPQNLFLYSTYKLDAAQFFTAILPVVAVSMVGLILSSCFLIKGEITKQNLTKVNIGSRKKLFIYALLFLLCFLTVFRVVSYIPVTLFVIAIFFIIDRKIFKDIDFMLLATFVCFFVISENLGRIESVRAFLDGVVGNNVLLTSIGTSQIISNVPAAVLLSGFTKDWETLLAGVNIGGLGTPVASLASLITLKLYMKSEGASILKFLSVFTIVNVVFLALLIVFYVFI